MVLVNCYLENARRIKNINKINIQNEQLYNRKYNNKF